MLMLLERSDYLISRVYITLQTNFTVLQQKIRYTEQNVKWLTTLEEKAMVTMLKLFILS